MSADIPFTVEHVEGVVKPEHIPDGYLHVIVFGPGHGEAILLRTPDGRMGLVDGCGPRPEEGTRRGSPIFGLLHELGTKRLLFACLTHPHRDHIMGFADLLQDYPPEHIWWPGFQERAFFDHYLRYLRKTRGDSVESSATAKPLVKDLSPVVAAIARFADDPPKELDPRPRGQHLSDWKLVLRHSVTGRATIDVNSILPSSSGVSMATEDALKAFDDKTLSAVRRIDPNRISAALLISWGETKILLGGDAICAGETDHQGWNGLQFPVGKVHVVKVPHHASEGAYSSALWDELQPALGIVTCVKNASDTQPPRPEMLETLLHHCNAVALTSCPAWWNSTSHKLLASPEWRVAKSAAAPKIGGALKAKAKTASHENKHENAVVVRIDDKGHISRVSLHGHARVISRPTTV